MTFPDYHARAELYLGSDRSIAIAQGARSFASAAQAIRFALEEAAPVSLRGALLKVGGTTFAGDDLAALYRHTAYPLPRKRDIKRSLARRARRLVAGGARAPIRSTHALSMAMA